jgi:hypothetical protein
MLMTSAHGVALLACLSGNLALDHPIPAGGTSEVFQYDDGSAYWISWDGLYRGVWFNVQDFWPGTYGAWLDYLEFWFYDHPNYPWDVTSFYAELYNGTAAAPVTLLDQTSLTAPHYAPVRVYYSPSIHTDENFWGLENTSMSSGGWPSMLGDDTYNPDACHSLFSNDFTTWTPWEVQGPPGNDYLVRAGVTFVLDQTTWAEIKLLF